MKAQRFLSGFIVSYFFATILFSSSATARTPSLRYRFIEGQTNVYSVQIEMRGESGRDTLNGNIFVVATNVSSNVFQLSLRGNLMPRREPGQMPFLSGPMRMPMNFSLNDGTEVQIDERGRILRIGTDIPLPIPLGQLTSAFFEILPENGSHWEIEDETFVLDHPMNTGPVDAYMGSRYGMQFFGPHQSPALLAVKREVKFNVSDKSGDLVSIRKQLHLESPLRNGADPRCVASGEGTLIFDTEKGLFRQIDLECKSLGNTENVLRKTSCELHIRLLEGTELEKALNPRPAAPPVARTITREEFQKILADLQSDDSDKRRSAVMKLNGREVANIPDESMEVFATLLADSDMWVRQTAANFLAANAGSSAVPYFIKLLKGGDYSVRQAAVKGLARARDARAAEPLAELVARGQSDSQEAANALTKIGAQAEDAVLELLKEKNVETCRRACQILGQIGTAKSIEPLKQTMLDPDTSLNQAASEAVRSIQIRL
jgi:hypothetical protein